MQLLHGVAHRRRQEHNGEQQAEHQQAQLLRQARGRNAQPFTGRVGRWRGARRCQPQRTNEKAQRKDHEHPQQQPVPVRTGMPARQTPQRQGQLQSQAEIEHMLARLRIGNDPGVVAQHRQHCAAKDSRQRRIRSHALAHGHGLGDEPGRTQLQRGRGQRIDGHGRRPLQDLQQQRQAESGEGEGHAAQLAPGTQMPPADIETAGQQRGAQGHRQRQKMSCCQRHHQLPNGV